jgi:hypothetical protein
MEVSIIGQRHHGHRHGSLLALKRDGRMSAATLPRDREQELSVLIVTRSDTGARSGESAELREICRAFSQAHGRSGPSSDRVMSASAVHEQ